MATTIYESGFIYSIDGEEFYITPLKIKYLRLFMKEFSKIDAANGDNEVIDVLVRCSVIAMRQYFPEITTVEQYEDVFDLDNTYELLRLSAGINFKKEAEGDSPPKPEKGDTWDTLDLAKLESEIFLLGIWKDYEELEESLSMQELSATLESKREIDYQEKKFMAAMQGVDLDEQSGKQNEWEEMKARVFSGGQTSDPNDILSYQGATATKAGFGIGNGLGYEKW